MKEILIFVFYTALYIINHKFEGPLVFLFIIPLLFFPGLVNVIFFDGKKHGISFLLTGFYILAIVALVGTYPWIFGMSEMDINVFVGLGYGILGIFFILTGIIITLVKLVNFKNQKIKQNESSSKKSIFISLAIVIVSGVIFILGITFITSDEYASIITKVATKANNSSICKLIIPPFMSSSPIGACYTSVAVQNKDIKKCIIVGWTCFRTYFEHYRPADNKICDVLDGTGYLVQCFQELQRALNR